MNMRRAMVMAMVAGAGMLGGCSLPFMDQSNSIEYKSAGKLPPLEIPPGLSSPTREDRFAVPDVPGSQPSTYSQYAAQRAGQPRPGVVNDLLPTVAKVRLERSGSQRWLVVNEQPEKLWPVVKEFWQEVGFLVRVEAPESGVMETDWAENRAKIPQDFIRSTIGRLFEGAYSTAERDKFRTRLERGSETGTTEVYISHRGVQEVYTGQKQDLTVWQPRPSDPELEAEFLRRLMVRLGVQEERAKAQVAASQSPDRAKLVRSPDGAGALELDEPFDRAWRRVGLALDRVGFTVEDRDRSKGYYFVRYVDPEKDAAARKEESGIVSRLMFWRSNPSGPGSAVQYRVLVKEGKPEASEVRVQNKDGGVENSDTSRRILSLLHDQLK
jgi:outer membrane protein assembly factor BamC